MQTEANVIQDDPVSAIPVNTTSSAPLIGRGLLLPFILITACFALWGAANNMTDLLVPAFQKVLGMTQLQSSFIQSAFYGAYFVMALPAAILIQKYSYKTGVMTGLSIYAIGALLCYPASQAMSFELFLIAFYVFASGCAVLETVAAPYILSMGSSETATQRINLAQAFNPVGVLMGVYLGKEVILKGLNTATDEQRASMSASELLGIQTQELGNVVSAYQVVALVAILLAVVVFIAKLPVAKSSDNFGNLKDSFNRLKKNTTWKFAVVTQFFYVGCQIGVWTYAIKYIMDNHPEVTTAAQAGEYVFWGLCVYTVFRFVCTGLMSYVRPAKLLCVMALLAITMVLIAVLVGGTIGTLALLTCFSCMSLMFPTIYGLGLSDVGEDRKLGGSFIIMAILGGAVLVPLQGWVIDITESVNISYLIPLSCFSVVFVFAWLTNKKLES